MVAMLVAATNLYGTTTLGGESGDPATSGSFWGPVVPTGSRGADYTFSGGLAAGGPGAWGVVLVLLAILPMVIALWYWRSGQNLIDSVRAQLAP
jgi:hypothetical protein